MTRKPPARRKRPSPLAGLRARLSDAEATLEAIRSGEVDALVVSAPGGERTLAIEGATRPYHALMDAMSDGAALVASDGTILFGNRRLGELARTPLETLRGRRLRRLVAPPDRPAFDAFLRAGVERAGAEEFAIVPEAGEPATPVRIALSAVPLGDQTAGDAGGGRGGPTVLMAIVTDLTERNRAEATRLGLMRRLLSAEDQERRRIARELHDETGQSLTALLVGLRAIEEQALTTDVKASATRLRGIAARTVDDVGRLARGLHPSLLDDMGFAAAARRHVTDYTRTFGIAVDLRLGRVASLRLSPLARTTLYRILQEALTNVARHAKARAVTVAMSRGGTMLELVVHDDGVGFEPAASPERASGLGLHGMRERVALLGGSVEIVSSPGHGTSVRARIPAGGEPPRRRPRRRRPSPRS